MAVNLDMPIKLEKREILGKGLQTIRQSGKVPAVVYHHGQPSLHVMAAEKDLVELYAEAGKHHPLNLEVGQQKLLALIKDVHYHPVKRRIQHVVFQSIRQDEEVEAEIPIHLEGEIPAEKVGLMVLRQLDSVVVEALPRNLPDEIKVNAKVLVEIGDKITVADLQVPEGVSIITEPDHPIVTVVETKAMISEEELAAEAAAAEAAAEGEVAEGEEGAEGQPAAESDETPAIEETKNK